MGEQNKVWADGVSYFEREGISATLLKAIIKQSPVHAQHRMEHFKATPAMNLGTAFHASVLEFEKYSELIAVEPEINKRTKAGKEEYAEFLKTVGNKTVITREQDETAQQMQEVCLAHPMVKRLLNDCDCYEMEVGFDYDYLAEVDNGMSIPCKAKIDAVSAEGKIIVDFKTTADASPETFSKQSANLLYHLQMAWYAKAMGWGIDEVSAYIVAVENKAPYGTVVYKLPEETLREGWFLCKRAVFQWLSFEEQVALQECCDDSIPIQPYYEYTTHAELLELPKWSKNLT